MFAQNTKKKKPPNPQEHKTLEKRLQHTQGLSGDENQPKST